MTKKKTNDGQRIMNVITTLERIEQKMQQEVKKLERKGCENLNLHIKAGTNKMFHRGGSPDPKTGKRDYRYIGTDPKKQQDALDRVRRYKQRETLFYNLTTLHRQKQHLKTQVLDLAEDAEDMLDHWRGKQLDLLG